MSTQTLAKQQMQRWPWAALDFTGAFICVVGGLFFVLASAYMPA